MTLIRFFILDISTLLSLKHFPHDTEIQNKVKLVERAIQRYLDRHTPMCVNNCTDTNHGFCDVSNDPPFQLGTCKCLSGWKGYDCSQPDVQSKFDS